MTIWPMLTIYEKLDWSSRDIVFDTGHGSAEQEFNCIQLFEFYLPLKKWTTEEVPDVNNSISHLKDRTHTHIYIKVSA